MNRMMTNLFRVLLGSVALGLGPYVLHAAGPYDEAIDSPMYRLPELPVPRVESLFPEGARELWLRALARPEADLKCQTAYAIARAHRSGIKGFEIAIEPLIKVLEQADAPANVRLAVAESLIALEARQAAPTLLRQAQKGGRDLREKIEPVLARWDHRPAREMWLTRLREAEVPPRERILALRGLATVGEVQAAEPLHALVLSERTSRLIRLEAARALAVLRTSGLEGDAARLAGDASPRGLVGRLLAASLLRRHRGAEAIRLLQRLSRDSEPSVAALAVARLFELDPELLVPSVEFLLARPDPVLRCFAVDVLRSMPSEKYNHLLIARLDDPHAEVRHRARRYLRELAGEAAWRQPIRTEAMAVLKARQWRSLEQAAILLTQLDHKPAAAALVPLLEFDRPEVALASAWGLRKLAVAETLPGVMAYVEKQSKQSLDPQSEFAGIRDHVLSQLNQFLGQQKHRPADALLRRFIPKSMNMIVGPESRAASLWALGRIHEGETVESLATAIVERLSDSVSIPPEDPRVRSMAAIALGRMKANSAVARLRQFYVAGEPSEERINNSCGWALEQITGEAMPPPRTIRKAQQGWFLIPQQGGATRRSEPANPD